MSVDAIGAIILAAGGSTRLGEPKQLLRYRGEMLVRRAARSALAAGCRHVIVVAGDAHERLLQELDGLDVHVHHHAEWQRGLGSSIRVGVTCSIHLNPSLDALLLMVCDQPHVTAEILTALISARAETRLPVVACAYSGIAGVPAVFDRALFSQLTELPDDEGAKHLLRKLAGQITQVPFPLGSIDIDTLADVREHLQTD